jgi:hypothetical protein
MASCEERLNPASGKTANVPAIPKEIRALAEMHGCHADRPGATGTRVAYGLLDGSARRANFYAIRDILAQLWQVIGKSSNRIDEPQVSSCFRQA